MQTPPKILALAFCLGLVSCGGGSPSGHGGNISGGGDGGGDETGGSGGEGGSAGSGGAGGSVTSHPDAASAGSGGSGGAGDPGGSGGGGGTAGNGTESLDATAGTGGGSADDGGTSSGGDDGGASTPGMAIGWYEAEAVPPNTLFGATTIVTCGSAPPCASRDAVKEGVECCSGGKKLSQLLRGKGGVVFNAVAAPSDGMFDVTWWYHCGKSDNFGDTNCGGAPHTPSGCRPHVLNVNGTQLPKVYHFPCYPGSWGQIHAATTTIALKNGMNSIKVNATPGRDAADLDAIVIFPAGKGTGPNIAGTAN